MLMVDRSRYKTDGPGPEVRNRSGMTLLDHRRLLGDPEKLWSALDALQDDKVVSCLLCYNLSSAFVDEACVCHINCES